MTFGLAIGTVPIQENTERYDEDDVRHDNGGDNGGHHFRGLVHFNDNPGVDAAVVTGKGFGFVQEGFVFGEEGRTGHVRWVATTLDIDQKRGIRHSLH